MKRPIQGKSIPKSITKDTADFRGGSEDRLKNPQLLIRFRQILRCLL